MIADTSDIQQLSVAQRRHADDLSSVAADLTAATAAGDAFGPVGAEFLAALNRALTQEAHQAQQLAERLSLARSTAGTAADAYRSAESSAGQSISLLTS
ncbi:type VII secretion target [Mycolicibacterium hodleri]|uniref:ESX-1 secretion-associated protein n=1 Tax=Mycolicibacterium hodleri TaxID=49897 RepID=A0A502EA57_9MYCO|nr:type VII secretion target [Mycolicibacterium hodleri]TPG34605.1 hypothetical protein EAH80_13915 [Mycolicibacterium hodleri]